MTTPVARLDAQYPQWAPAYHAALRTASTPQHLYDALRLVPARWRHTGVVLIGLAAETGPLPLGLARGVERSLEATCARATNGRAGAEQSAALLRMVFAFLDPALSDRRLRALRRDLGALAAAEAMPEGSEARRLLLDTVRRPHLDAPSCRHCLAIEVLLDDPSLTSDSLVGLLPAVRTHHHFDRVLGRLVGHPRATERLWQRVLVDVELETAAPALTCHPAAMACRAVRAPLLQHAACGAAWAWTMLATVPMLALEEVLSTALGRTDALTRSAARRALRDLPPARAQALAPLLRARLWDGDAARRVLGGALDRQLRALAQCDAPAAERGRQDVPAIPADPQYSDQALALPVACQADAAGPRRGHAPPPSTCCAA